MASTKAAKSTSKKTPAKSPRKDSKSRKAKPSAPAAHPSVTLAKPGKDEVRIRYTVSIPEPWTHNIEVEVEILGVQSESVDLQMPAWTPGSYKIREFARNVSHFVAFNAKGEDLPVSMLDKQTWRIASGKSKRVVARFRVYGFELSVRTPHIDETHAFFQPTNVLPYVVGHTNELHELIIRPVPQWNVACPLTRVESKEKFHFVASNYDILADAPVEAGSHEEASFEVDGKLHQIAIYGWGNYDVELMKQDFAAIVQQGKAMFGSLPYDNYLFILHCVPNNRGGLEHLNSQVSAWPSLDFDTREKYEDFLSLISHEFFHTWNVKRIRPAVLGPFDYSKEQYTPNLWVMEGLTVYYEWIQLVRAGVVAPKRFLKALAEEINRWMGRPGNGVMSVRNSSFLAWTKLYLADENFVNTGISYYLKGGLIGLCLDAEIRRRSKNVKSLDDVMRLAFERFGWPKPGFEDGGFEALVAEITGGNWDAWFAEHLEGKQPLDLDGALSVFGLALEREQVKRINTHGQEEIIKELPWIGWDLKEDNGKLTIQTIRDGSPAALAALSAKDELLAIEDNRMSSKDQVRRYLNMFQPGEEISITVFHGDFLSEHDLVLGAELAGNWTIVPKSRSGKAQAAARHTWFGGRDL